MSKMLTRLFKAQLLTAASIAPVCAQQLAFPTAEGFGRFAKGGRGGDVYVVSNLNDSGPGSLRECAEASGPRTCVFSVSGEIKVKDSIRIRNPYVTIAGQTAPGDGIMITIRNGPSLNYPLQIGGHDVIVRHIALRPGPSMQKSSNVDALLLGGKNIIVDHVSMSWGTDETINAGGNGGTDANVARENSSDITIQWSMIYESLKNSTHPSGNHSRSTYLGYGVQDVSFHHNIIAHSTRRNPNIGALGQFDFVNNVIYNVGQYFGEIYNRHGTSNVNWVGNIAIGGPDTPRRTNMFAVNLFNNGGLAEHHLYVKDNLDINRKSFSQDERLVVDPKDWKYISDSPVGYGELSLSPGSVTDAAQAYKDVLAFAGANRPTRDSADARLVDEVKTCTGGIIDDPNERGGWPTLRSASAPADSDRDGMPDSWEASKGLDPRNADDRNGDADGDGYTNLEEYLHERAGDDQGVLTGRGAGPDPDPTCGYSFYPAETPEIFEFRVEPQSARPGDTVTIYWDADAGSCSKSWNRNISPHLMKGSDDFVLNQTTGLGLDCITKGVDDKASIYAFATPDGSMPIPKVTLKSDKSSYQKGETIRLEWVSGEPRNTEAGECRASGGWSGIKSVIGIETLTAEYSGDYTLSCKGPGGVGSKTINIDVSGGKAPPPAPTPSPTPPPPAPPPAPRIAISAAAADKPEGDQGMTPFTFSVTRTGDLSRSSSVDFRVSGAGANSDDFGGSFPSGDVRFANGESAKQISVGVSGDVVQEADERFVVELVNPSGGQISISAATGTILNDDRQSSPPPAPPPAPGPTGPDACAPPPPAACAAAVTHAAACAAACANAHPGADAHAGAKPDPERF